MFEQKKPLCEYPRWTWKWWTFINATRSEYLIIGTWEDFSKGKKKWLYLVAAYNVIIRWQR